MLGEIHMDKCAYDIHYLKSVFEFVVGIESRTEKYENIVTNWRLKELPMGLSLDELSGEISGIPLVESDKGVYRRMGENRDGVGSVEIEIMARRGVCKDEVEVVSVDCSGNGLYIGYEKKRCVLGEENGG